MSAGVRPAGVPLQTVRPRSRRKQRSATRDSSFRVLSMTRMASVALERVDRGPDFLADDRREAFGRLVEDEQPRVRHQRPADRQHLLLAAGEGAGALRAALGEAGEERLDASLGPAAGAGGGGEVLLDAERREAAAALGDEADAEPGDAVDGEAAGRLAGEADRALARAQERRDGADRGGLAHAVAAHQRHDLALADVEVDAEERLAGAVEGGDAVELQERRHAASSPR